MAGVVNELAVDKLVRTFFKNRYVREILSFLRKITLRISRSGQISASGRKNEKSTYLIVTNDVRTVVENPSNEEIRSAR